jgi:hypothetical protein
MMVSEKRLKARGKRTATRAMRKPSSFIRTVTVGSRIALDLLTCALLAKSAALAGSRLTPPTAGGDFHPALKTRQA